MFFQDSGAPPTFGPISVKGCLPFSLGPGRMWVPPRSTPTAGRPPCGHTWLAVTLLLQHATPPGQEPNLPEHPAPAPLPVVHHLHCHLLPCGSPRTGFTSLLHYISVQPGTWYWVLYSLYLVQLLYILVPGIGYCRM